MTLMVESNALHRASLTSQLQLASVAGPKGLAEQIHCLPRSFTPRTNPFLRGAFMPIHFPVARKEKDRRQALYVAFPRKEERRKNEDRRKAALPNRSDIVSGQ